MKILHTCSPHLSDVATLPWKVKKVSFNSIVYTYFWLLNIFFRLVKRLYRHYINHNQILFTLTFRSLSGSCHGSDVTWQEIGRTCGSESTILDTESERGTRWIKEAVHIRKEGGRSMNRDEDSHTLSHTYILLFKKRKRWTFWSTV